MEIQRILIQLLLAGIATLAGGPGNALSFDGTADRVQALTNSFPAAFNSTKSRSSL